LSPLCRQKQPLQASPAPSPVFYFWVRVLYHTPPPSPPTPPPFCRDILTTFPARPCRDISGALLSFVLPRHSCFTSEPGRHLFANRLAPFVREGRRAFPFASPQYNLPIIFNTTPFFVCTLGLPVGSPPHSTPSRYKLLQVWWSRTALRCLSSTGDPLYPPPLLVPAPLSFFVPFDWRSEGLWRADGDFFPFFFVLRLLLFPFSDFTNIHLCLSSRIPFILRSFPW